MRRDNWARQRRAAQLAGAGVILLLLLVPGGRPQAEEGPGWFSLSCPPLSAEEIYERMKRETLSHNTYTAVYFHATERGKEHEIFVHGRMSGRYIQKPGRWCEKRLELKASFPEQAGAGYQECYDGQEDIMHLLLPGPYRMLGVITMFPEDPKASYLNGENLKRTPVWAWFEKWDRMREGGELTAECGERQGRAHWVLTIVRGRNPDPLYHHVKEKIWVDPQLWFPVRTETYADNDPRPVMIYDFEEVKLDVPLKPEEVTFEGLAPGWKLVSVPGGPRLERLSAVEPELREEPGLDARGFLARLDQALAEVKDYSTELTLEMRYRRLRQFRQDRFLYLRASRAFSVLTTHLEANYLQPNGGEGFRSVYDPERDPLLHVFPGGIYKVMGEQTFPRDDPRLFTSLGDNITELDFFSLRNELARRLERAVEVKTGRAVYAGVSGPWLEVRTPDIGIPACPTVMRFLLEEKSSLPGRVEYRGYDDPAAYLAISFCNTKINTGLKREDL